MPPATVPARARLLPRAPLLLLAAAGAALTVGALQASASIVAPAFLALVLTVTVHPVRALVARTGAPSSLGTVVALVTVYVVLIAVVGSILLAGARLATLLPLYEDDLRSLVASTASALDDLGLGQAQREAITESFDVGRLADLVGGFLGSVASLFSGLVFVVTLLLFFAMDAAVLPGKLSRLEGQRSGFVFALVSFAQGTRRYFVVSTVFGLIVAVFDTIFIWLTPIPAPLLWGLLAFITNYVPNIGFVIGLVPPAVLGLLEGGPGLMVLVIAVYCGVNFVIQSVIQPKYVGDAVGLSPSITMLSLVFWTWVIGPLGALLAVPLSLLTKALLVDADSESAWLRNLLAGDQDETGAAASRDGSSPWDEARHPLPSEAGTNTNPAGPGTV
jgi:AI-2 transport protein TqsA